VKGVVADPVLPAELTDLGSGFVLLRKPTICSVENLDFRIGPPMARTEIITESDTGFQVNYSSTRIHGTLKTLLYNITLC